MWQISITIGYQKTKDHHLVLRRYLSIINSGAQKLNTHLKFNIAPEVLPAQKERIVFQPSFLRGKLLNFRECTTILR